MCGFSRSEKTKIDKLNEDIRIKVKISRGLKFFITQIILLEQKVNII